MRFRILGPLTVRENGRTVAVAAARQRTILAALLVRANLPVSAEELIDIVWGEHPPAAARDTLRSYVMRLRRALPELSERLRTQPPGYLLEVAPQELDADVFATLLEAATGAAAGADWPTVRDRTGEALGLWRDAPLLDVPSAALHRDEVPRLRELRWQAVELWAEAQLRLGGHDRLIPALRGYVAEDPLREALTGHLMLALARSGRQAEALVAFRATRDRLVAELGVEPGPALQSVHQQVLRGETGSVRPVPAQLPPDLPDFTGRVTELDRLVEALEPVSSAAATAVVAVCGPGGIGKSALAVHAAHLARPRFPDGVLYVELGSDPAEPVRLVGRLLRDLGVAPESIPTDADERVSLYRSVCSDRRLLVVLDGAESTGQVRPLLPGGAGCAVVVTSRHTLADLAGARRVDLRELAAEQALDLLRAILGKKTVEADPAATDRVVAACAGLPLALRIVAARIASRPGWDMSVLAERLLDPDRRLDELHVGALGVREAFALSYAAVPADRQRAFRLVALVAGPGLDGAGAAALLDCPPRHAEAMLEELADAGLLVTSRSGRYGLHDLVRAYALERGRQQDDARQQRAALDRLLRWYVTAAAAAAEQLGRRSPLPAAGSPAPPPVPDRDAALAWLDAHYPSLVAACAQAAAEGFDEAAWLMPTALWSYFDLRKQWDDWIATHRAALVSVQRLADPAAVARVRNNLAIALLFLRRFDEAREHLSESLRLRRELGDANGEAAVLTNLARLHETAGDLDAARDALRRAVALRRSAGDEVGRAYALINLGIVQRQRGDLVDSTACAVEALDITAGLDLPVVEAAATTCLAENRRGTGDLAGAEAYCRRSLALQERAGDGYERAHTLVVLGEVLRDAGRLDEARAAVGEAAAEFAAFGAPEERDARTLLAELSPAPRPPAP